ncbi:MAG: hypothetical protein PHF70_10750 [Opitutales bacterium]|nr:hypothetical protein [Opitutales bacterium]
MPTTTHSQPKIRFCLDHSDGIGWGHGVRCSTIAHELTSAGFHVELMTTTPGDPPAIWGGAFEAIHHIPSWDNPQASSVCDAWVLDQYDLRKGHSFYEALLRINQKVIVVDDLPDPFAVAGACGVINPNPYAKPSDYPGIPSACGPSFALIRPAFKTPGTPPQTGRGLPPGFIVMIMGGSDPKHIAERCWRWIQQGDWDPPLPVVFVNPPFKIPDSSKHLATGPLNAPALSHLFSQARCILSAAGSTLGEIVCCHSPFLAIRVASNQDLACAFAETVWKMPVIDADKLTPQSLSIGLSRMDLISPLGGKPIFDPAIDGEGPARASAFIIRLASQVLH